MAPEAVPVLCPLVPAVRASFTSPLSAPSRSAIRLKWPRFCPVSMTAASGPRYDWTRLTYPRGRDDGGYADEHGWFVPLPAWHFPGRRSPLAPLAGVRDEPAIVLTSAGGTGKSTALAQEHRALAGAACLIDLKGLAGKPDPGAWLSAQAAVPAVARGLLARAAGRLRRGRHPRPGAWTGRPVLDSWLGQQQDRGPAATATGHPPGSVAERGAGAGVSSATGPGTRWWCGTWPRSAALTSSSRPRRGACPILKGSWPGWSSAASFPWRPSR